MDQGNDWDLIYLPLLNSAWPSLSTSPWFFCSFSPDLLGAVKPWELEVSVRKALL
jgi:hypothetical protein